MPNRRDNGDFNYEEWGLTRAQYNRLRKAVDDGIIPYSIAFSRKNLSLYKVDPSLSDHFIRVWSRDSYKDPYADIEIDISQYEFEQIVHEAARKTSGVISVEVVGPIVYAKFSSRSGKEIWEAKYDFNDNGRITGKCSLRAKYDNANALSFFAGNVQMLIKRLIDNKVF